MKSIRAFMQRTAAVALLAMAGNFSLLGAETALASESAERSLLPPCEAKACCKRGLDDHAALGVCINALMAEEIFFGTDKLEDNNVAGATVAIVKDGKAILTRGFGCADTKTRTPVDGTKTLFRGASISKLFTATAVMQLVEQGKLDLDTDVNEYLDDFKIPATFPQPVTLKNLLTHTAGFEENVVGVMVKRRKEDLVDLGKNLAAHMPARVRPPTTNFSIGRDASYSNWGFALAGHIVALRSDMSFDDYVDKKILGPLEMSRSTFREPLPEEWGKQLAKGHVYRKARPSETAPIPRSPGNTIQCPPHAYGTFEPKDKPEDFEYFHSVAPASGLTTTAADMANFMIAHLAKGKYIAGLANGQYEERHILKRETAELMHSRVLSPQLPVAKTGLKLNGAGLGFYEIHWNGRRVLTHRGTTRWFMSKLVLLPDENTGLFIAVNSPVEPRVLRYFVNAFLDEYFPAEQPAEPLRFQGGTVARYAGAYFSNPDSYTNNEKFLSLVDTQSEIKVRPLDGQTLEISNLSGPSTRWEQVEPGVFRRVVMSGGARKNRHDLIAFVENDRSEVSHMLGPMAASPAYKLAWHERLGFHRGLLGLASLSFVVAMVWAAIYREPKPVQTVQRLARWLAAAVAGVNLIALAILWNAFSDVYELSYGYSYLVLWALTLLLISIPITGAVGYCAITAWLRNSWTGRGRVLYTLFTLMALAFLWSMNHWNLIGYKLA